MTASLTLPYPKAIELNKVGNAMLQWLNHKLYKFPLTQGEKQFQLESLEDKLHDRILQGHATETNWNKGTKISGAPKPLNEELLKWVAATYQTEIQMFAQINTGMPQFLAQDFGLTSELNANVQELPRQPSNTLVEQAYFIARENWYQAHQAIGLLLTFGSMLRNIYGYQSLTEQEQNELSEAFQRFLVKRASFFTVMTEFGILLGGPQEKEVKTYIFEQLSNPRFEVMHFLSNWHTSPSSWKTSDELSFRAEIQGLNPDLAKNQ